MRVSDLLMIAAALLSAAGLAAGQSEARAMVLAQNTPGNVGGVIGKPSKPAPAKPSAARTRSDGLPQAIHLTERSHAGTYTITLRRTGGSIYGGTWSHGYVTTFVIATFNQTRMILKRTDAPAFGAVTGTYTGTRAGKTASGDAVVSNGITPKWEAAW